MFNKKGGRFRNPPSGCPHSVPYVRGRSSALPFILWHHKNSDKFGSFQISGNLLYLVSILCLRLKLDFAKVQTKRKPIHSRALASKQKTYNLSKTKNLLCMA